MKYMASLLLSTPLLLAACQSHHLSPTKKESAIVNGMWAALPKSCQIHGRTEDFTLAADGEVENGNIYIYLTFKTRQIMPPVMNITGLNLPLAPEGRSPVYSYKVAFTPAIAQRLAEPATYFVIRYYSAGNTKPFESALPTTGFIEALNLLPETCR